MNKVFVTLTSFFKLCCAPPVKASFDLQLADRSQLPCFYREFLEERDQILRNKRLLSEGAGHDVDFDVALMDWVTRHREAWLASRSSRVPN